MAQKSCYQRAVDLLARRAHFTAELRAKLQQRGFEADEVEETLERLRSYGYLNETETARLWVEQQLARKPQGARKLLAGLRSRGVDPDLASSTVDGALPEGELEMARRATERKLPSLRPGDEPALARYLDRLGFGASTVMRMVERARSHGADGLD